MATKPADNTPAWRYYQDWLTFLGDAELDFGAGVDVIAGGLESLGDTAVGGTLETAQNVIVGGTLYTGTDQIIVPAAAFQQTFGGGGVLGSGGIWGTTATGVLLLAPVLLPEGRRITDLEWHYNRGGSGTITLEIRREATGGLPVVIDSQAVSSGTGWTSTAVSGLNYTLGSTPGSQTYLSVQMSANTNLLGYVIVTYDRLAP